MNANFNARNMYRTVERMDGSEYSIEIIIISLKQRITGTNIFLEENIPLLKELLKQRVTVRSIVKVNTVSFKEWMTATLSFTKIDTLLQRENGWN